MPRRHRRVLAIFEQSCRSGGRDCVAARTQRLAGRHQSFRKAPPASRSRLRVRNLCRCLPFEPRQARVFSVTNPPLDIRLSGVTAWTEGVQRLFSPQLLRQQAWMTHQVTERVLRF